MFDCDFKLQISIVQFVLSYYSNNMHFNDFQGGQDEIPFD